MIWEETGQWDKSNSVRCQDLRSLYTLQMWLLFLLYLLVIDFLGDPGHSHLGTR